MSPGHIWNTIDEKVNADAEKVEQSSRRAAEFLGCTGDDETIVRCMQSRPLDDIIKLYSVSLPLKLIVN